MDHIPVQHTTPLVTFFITGLNGRTSYRIKFLNCEECRNCENQFLEPTKDGMPNNSRQNLAQICRCIVQGSSGGGVINNWLLLDSCSTIIFAKNNSIVSNITVIPSEENLRLYSNGVHTDYNMRGTVYILPMIIYVNDNSMANILSFKKVAYYFHVTMYTK